MGHLFQRVSSIRFLDSVNRILVLIFSFLVIWHALVFLLVATIRMLYPYELEWIEGAYVDQALRIVQGYFPYGSPNIFLIPVSKTPIFFYLSAGFMKILGVGFLAPRLVSILSTIGICGLLFWGIKAESQSWLPAVMAAGIYIASYRLSGAWMDLAKTDSLFLLILLVAFIIGQRAQRWPGWMVSGILFALAYFTKQLALPIVLALAVVSLIVRRGRNWVQWVTAFGLGIGLFVGLDYFSQGWFSFYTLETGTSHTRIEDISLFWKKILPAMWPAIVLAIYYAWCVFRRSRPSKFELRPAEWENLAFGGVLVITSWSIFLKVWTYDNGIMMAALGLAFLSGLGVAELYRPPSPLETAHAGNTRQFAFLVLAVAQLSILIYYPSDQIPTRQDKAAAKAFVHRIEQLPGEVLVFNHGFYSHLAGKQTYLHSAPFSDVLGANIPKSDIDPFQRQQTVIEVFDQAISDQYFNWIILDDPNTSWTPYYLFVEDISPQDDALFPVTGAPARPASLTVRNPVVYGGDVPMTDPTYDFLFSEEWLRLNGAGRWAISPRAELELFLEKDGYVIQMMVEPNCVEQHPVVEKMDISWNAQKLGEVRFDTCESQSIRFDLPRKLIRKTANNLVLEFEGIYEEQLAAGPAEMVQALAKIKTISFLQQ